MSDWRTYLNQNLEANQAFESSLRKLIAQARQEMDDATTWETVLEARGKVKILAFLVDSLTMAEKEEAAYVRAYGHSRATKSA